MARDDRYPLCSYTAMGEWREHYLRTGQGPARFAYDCGQCKWQDDCPFPEQRQEAGEQ